VARGERIGIDDREKRGAAKAEDYSLKNKKARRSLKA
jgi:hypothetical protein